MAPDLLAELQFIPPENVIHKFLPEISQLVVLTLREEIPINSQSKKQNCELQIWFSLVTRSSDTGSSKLLISAAEPFQNVYFSHAGWPYDSHECLWYMYISRWWLSLGLPYYLFYCFRMSLKEWSLEIGNNHFPPNWNLCTSFPFPQTGVLNS